MSCPGLLRHGLNALLVFSLAGLGSLECQNSPDQSAPDQNGAGTPATYTVETGTRIPLGLINSVSTKHSAPGDKIYLETVVPIVINQHIVIPPGSYVFGTVTEVKRPGRVRGRAELYVRFDSLLLPNGASREFRSRLGGIDAREAEHLDKKEGKILGDANKGGDAKVIAEGAITGASLGAIVGSTAGHAAMGAGVGGAAGAAAGMAGVLLTRGPDAMLSKGDTIEMILDRPLVFSAAEVNFTNAAGSGHFSDAPAPVQANRNGVSNPLRRLPF